MLESLDSFTPHTGEVYTFLYPYNSTTFLPEQTEPSLRTTEGLGSQIYKHSPTSHMETITLTPSIAADWAG